MYVLPRQDGGGGGAACGARSQPVCGLRTRLSTRERRIGNYDRVGRRKRGSRRPKRRTKRLKRSYTILSVSEGKCERKVSIILSSIAPGYIIWAQQSQRQRTKEPKEQATYAVAWMTYTADERADC